MKAEKIFISFFAVVIGILVAGIAFYFYQTAKILPDGKSNTLVAKSPTPTPKGTLFLAVEQPKDEEVIDKKTLIISGTTSPTATLVISTDAEDQVVSPSSLGSFSASVAIDDGANHVTITAIDQNGEEITETRTVTFSTETF